MPVDYAALAEQARQPSPPQTGTRNPHAEAPVDYAALAERARGDAKPDFHVDVKASDLPWDQILQSGFDEPQMPIPQHISDALLGGVKKGAQSIVKLGNMAEHLPVLGRLLHATNQYLFGLTPEQQHHAFEAAQRATEPANTAEKVGAIGEQIGEVLLPSGAVERAGATAVTKAAPFLERIMPEVAARALPKMATEAAANATIAKAQGGNPLAAGIAGAAAPVLGEASGAIADRLKSSATKQVQQAIVGAGKERFKAIAERLTPEILKRGLRGSRESLLEQATDALETAGGKLDDALAQFGEQPVSVQPIVNALETTKDAFRTTKTMSVQDALLKGHVTLKNSGVVTSGETQLLPNGLVAVSIPLEPRTLQQLNGLQNLVEQVGPVSSVEQLRAIRQAWDKVVAQAGGYAHRAPGALGVPLADQSEAWAKREGATAIRKLLAEEVPQLADVNKEYSFWKNLSDVLTYTIKKKAPQDNSLGKNLAEVGGAVMGAKSGVGAAFLMGKLNGLLQRTFASPRYRLMSAQYKNQLADAIASGNVNQVSHLAGRVIAVEGSKLATAQ